MDGTVTHDRTLTGLPIEAYTSMEWLARERATIFGDTWQFAGLVEDVAGVGDYVTVQAGPFNILVVRGQDERLRAFHNLCRHRGTQLLRAVGRRKKVITCPYHDWSYSLDGELIAVPKEESEFPGLDKSKLCLHRAGVETWRGMVFVHANSGAEPLSEWLGDLPSYLGPHRPEELEEIEQGSGQQTIEANWKIVAENFLDGYHLAHLHSATLDMYDHSRQVTGQVGSHFHFTEPLGRRYRDNLDKASPLPRIDHIADDQLGVWAPLVFPNLGLSETESSWMIFHMVPLAPDRTQVVYRTKIMPVSSWKLYAQGWSSASYFAGKKPKVGGKGDDDPLASGDFMAEDVYVCEQQQRSLESPLFAESVTAKTLEASVRGFRELVRRRVLGH